MRSEAQILEERTQQLVAWERAQRVKIAEAWDRLPPSQQKEIRALYIQPNDRCPEDLPAHILTDVLGVEIDPYPVPCPEFVMLQSKTPNSVYERLVFAAPAAD